MRILLDECIDVAFAGHISDHQVSTVSGIGWAGTRNGELLRRAAESFEVFITIDQNLPFQQNLSKAPLKIVLLRPRSSRIADLLYLRPALLETLRVAGPKIVVLEHD